MGGEFVGKKDWRQVSAGGGANCVGARGGANLLSPYLGLKVEVPLWFGVGRQGLLCGWPKSSQPRDGAVGGDSGLELPRTPPLFAFVTGALVPPSSRPNPTGSPPTRLKPAHPHPPLASPILPAKSPAAKLCSLANFRPFLHRVFFFRPHGGFD